MFSDIFKTVIPNSPAEFDVCSFHYTTPRNLFPSEAEASVVLRDYINIHGTAKHKGTDNNNNKQIIGIAKYPWTLNSELKNTRKFLKTHRLEKNMLGRLQCRRNTYTNLLFFGHSLSDIDYPQLFKILDLIGLPQNDNVQIHFIFKNFRGTSESTASGELRTKSEKLFDAYLNTIETVPNDCVPMKLSKILNNQVHFVMI